MRVALDATPLLGRRTGVGQYTAQLVAGLTDPALAPADLDVRLVPFTLRGAGGLDVPGATVSRRRFPARVLQQLWSRTSQPPVELFSGACDVFHATNFVLPPRRRAAGVVTVHDLTFVRYPAAVTEAVRRYRRTVPRSVRSADVVLCPARATAADVGAEFGLDPARVLVTPLGVDPVWLAAEPAGPALLRRLGLPERYFLFVGTREPRKNLSTLVEAHDLLTAADPQAPALVLAGPAGWGPQPVAAPHRVVVDYLDFPDLVQVVAGAVALTLPSHYEGFGLPLLEGLAAGVPVVASDLAVHREVAGPHAAYVAPTDVDGFSAALSAAAAADRDDASRAARRTWAGRWSWQECVRTTVAAYRTAAGAR